MLPFTKACRVHSYLIASVLVLVDFCCLAMEAYFEFDESLMSSQSMNVFSLNLEVVNRSDYAVTIMPVPVILFSVRLLTWFTSYMIIP
jgi:c-di-AMP phosphodiesterase-like protein